MFNTKIQVLIDDKWCDARDYQREAFLNLMASNEKCLNYDRNTIKFTIEKIVNHPSYARITRENGTSFLISNNEALHGKSPQFPHARQSSSNFNEAKSQTATEDFDVYYACYPIKIKKDTTYYVDNDNNVLIGWHGTYDPPIDMAGISILNFNN